MMGDQMSQVDDFIVVNVPAMLSQTVTISDETGHERPDPDWNREAAESQYIFAEFLAAKGLLVGNTTPARNPDLLIRWSQLTELGKRFARNDFHKWLLSIKSGTSGVKKLEKLERRWSKFVAVQATK